jgi:cell division protein FtsQ
MIDTTKVSESVLRHRRKKLRHHRRWKVVAVIWQTLALTGMAGGLVWAIAQPFWGISSARQVNVEGNQLLSDEAIVSLLPLEYPQSLWFVQPELLARHLESRSHIARALVTRHLFPPGLTLLIVERHPVAITQPSTTPRPGDAEKMGWLDADGNWIPLATYSHLAQSRSLPTLMAIGPLERYRQYWQLLYKSLSRTPVKVFEIDWQAPGNLILTTELGVVHLGPFSSKFNEQLSVLDRMRQLPNRQDAGEIAYIDLKNPASPSIKFIEGTRQEKPKAD